ncbi:diguanylate cyclase [Oceanospirillum sp.]|uniref:sensor domain-containing diguanylate cyclase n=1 Tax=Oceanospirillum sp. TaxID=2021254 RepID=UPI003A941115
MFESVQFLKKEWKRLLVLTCGAYLVITLALLAGKDAYDQGFKNRVVERHQYLLNLTENRVHQFVLRVALDAQQLSILPSVRHFISSPSKANRLEVEDIFRRATDVDSRYDQVRIIDLSGQELIRINDYPDGARPVAIEHLQNKYDRYYVQEGLKLAPGQIYLSPLDLNEERGEVEQPYKPVIRAVTLLTDELDAPVAMVVLNYKAGHFLNRFRAHFEAGDRGMLVNSDGYWLSNHFRESEWGWQLHRPDKIIAAWNAELWQKMQQQSDGVVDANDELISYRKIRPAEFDEFSDGRFNADLGLKQDVKVQSWFSMVRTSKDEWLANAFYHHLSIKLLIGFIYFSVFTLVWFFLKHRIAKQINEQQRSIYTAELEDLYYNAPVGYLTFDATSLITNANNKTLEYLGYDRDELVNKKCLREMLSDASKAQLNMAMSTHYVGDLRLDLQCKDGRWLPVASAISSKFHGSSLTISRCSVQDISLQLELEQRLKALANTDALTGAYNRRYVEKLFLHALEELSPENDNLAILMLDIDHFKNINDTYGHSIGDDVLVAFTRLCQECLGDQGYFSRFGGEEFLAVLPGMDLSAAALCAEHIRAETEALRINNSTRDNIAFTVSIGVAVYDDSEAATLDQLVYRADEALYRAKNSGRNQVCAESVRQPKH